MFSAQNILDFAVRLEKNGESVYRQAQDRTTDSDLIRLLEWTADEEERHGVWFSRLKDEADLDKDHHLLKDMNDALVNEYFKDQSFSLKEVDFSKIESPEKMIGVFIEFEEDTILFYEMMASFITDKKTVSQLNQIIQEEQYHIQKLQDFLSTDS